MPSTNPPLIHSPFLKSLPIAAFASVMGLCGLSLVWARVAAVGWWPALAQDISIGSAAVAAAWFVGLSVLYLRKAIRRPAVIEQEWQHPIKSAFFAAIAVSFALLGTLALIHLPAWALPLWAIGAVLQVAAMLLVLNAWIHRESVALQHASPVWFIPAVANVVIPLGGVPLGYQDLSWWFFAVGILFWGLLFTLVMARLLFVQPAMPAKLLPSLGIFLAPPAVGFISWMQLTGQIPASIPLAPPPLDITGHLLYGTAVFFALFLLSQGRRFVRLPFGLTAWAYTFPMAAFTVATLIYQQAVPKPTLTLLAGGLVALCTALIVMIFGRTLWAIWRQEAHLVE